MTSLMQSFANYISAFKFESLHNHKTYKKPIRFYSLSRAKTAYLHHNRFKVRAYGEMWPFLGGSGHDFGGGG
jgi:hypothetical protein